MKIFGIASPFTGSGKTTITLAFANLLENSAVFKIGPDFIDTGLARSITNYAENIDRYLESKNYRNLLCDASLNFDYGIFEGVMGLYDSGTIKENSTYYYFKKFKIPHILVIDVSRMAESSYYIYKGFRNSLTIGVILNNFYGQKHLEIVEKPFLENNVKIIGEIPHDEEIKIKERHLGLYTFFENRDLRKKIEKVGGYLDLDFLDDLPEFKCYYKENFRRIGNFKTYVAMDRSFNFYYQYNLSLLSNISQVIYFSPLKNESVEDANMVYIGGGYPEIYKEKLSMNRKTIDSLIESFNNGKIIYGECGGLMYLSKEIISKDKKYPMVGIFSSSIIENSGLTLGYTYLKANKDYFFLKKGETLKGHEYHYSSMLNGKNFALSVLMGKGVNGYDGLMNKRAFAQYTHIHFFPYRRKIIKYLEKVYK